MISSRGQHSEASDNAREGWWFAAIGAVTLLAYARSFTSPFQFDDYSQVLGTPAIQVPTLKAFLGFGRARLVPFATLALNYRLGAEDPFGYHVVNFAIHLLATLAVYQLALALCRTPRLRDTRLASQRLPLAMATALVFACHPIQIQAVTYIVQRMTSMATLFYVGAVLFYIRARNAQVDPSAGRPVVAFTISILSALAAFCSKESTASLPLAIGLTEWVFFGASSTRRRLLRLAPFLALVLVIPLMWKLFGVRGGGTPEISAPLSVQVSYLFNLMTFRASPDGQATPFEYFLTQGRVVPSYLRLVVLPWGYNVDHDVPIARALSPAVAGGLTFLAALFGFGLYALRRWPLVGFGVLWIFIGLSVESSFLPISDVMVEHRMYLAMPGVALVLGVAFAWAHARWPRPALGVGASVVALLVTLTLLRNEVWHSAVSLWQDAIDKSPGKSRVYANLGTALHLEGKRDEAVAYYCKALALDPKNRQAQSNLDAVMAEKVDDAVDDVEDDDGKEVDLEGGPTGADGEMELTMPNPCPPTPAPATGETPAG